MDIQSQIVCAGCRSLLVYPRRATNVRCALCGTVTSIAPSPSLPPPPASDQLICGGCRTLLMYAHGATSVRCSCCNTVNVTRPSITSSNQFAHVNCGNCRTTLMYPCGAQSVKCALCQYVTNVGMNNLRVPIPTHRPNGSVTATPSTSAMPQSKSQTVVIENPMSLDGSGKLVSNVAVGVTTEKK